MSAIAEILWEAAADVERRGVTRFPSFTCNETCAANAVGIAAEGSGCSLATLRLALRIGLGLGRGEGGISAWNDSQPSRAVVAAAMRDAAYLAEWAGPHLLKGKP